jgi:acyl carrier protein
MDKTQIEQTLRPLFAEHLAQGEEKIIATARMSDDLGADSLDSVELSMLVEEEFSIDVEDAFNEKPPVIFADWVDLVDRHVNA